jgi:hypothetical protein
LILSFFLQHRDCESIKVRCLRQRFEATDGPEDNFPKDNFAALVFYRGGDPATVLY